MEAMAEYLGLAALQCELAQRYADAGDGVGLAYAMRKFAAYAKAAPGTRISTPGNPNARRAADEPRLSRKARRLA